MSSPRIDPFCGLEQHDERFVEPPGRSATDLADLVAAGLAPMLWVGHAGQGKSSRLARLERELRRRGPVVAMDLAEIRGGVSADRVLYDIAQATVQWWVHEGPDAQPSPFLVQDLRASDPSFPQGQGRTLPPDEIARAAWDELTGAVGVERIPLLVDGVDALEPTLARAVLGRLLTLDSRASLVVIGSPELATGLANRAIVDRYRVVDLPPADPAKSEHLSFLVAVVRAHLSTWQEGADLSEVLAERIARASGGVLRDLLVIARDAWSYAANQIDDESVSKAIVDRSERYRRLITDGDLAALMAADGTSGLEVPAGRKARLLTHGLLLEAGVGVAARVRIHPLARAFVSDDGV